MTNPVLYDIRTETEIANAVAQKAFKTESLSASKQEKEARALEVFQKTLGRRALAFLKTIEQKLDELSNPEIATLLRVLLLSGLRIESEEELEYWINLLEQITRQRLNTFFQAQNTETFSVDDLRPSQIHDWFSSGRSKPDNRSDGSSILGKTPKKSP